MSKTISIKKLKRIMYACLRYRLQLPNYVHPHNPIPSKEKLSNFSQGTITAYQDLLREIQRIEAADNQRRIFNESSYSDEWVEEYSWENLE